ncbi:unnamed protein product [Caenorhabditis sp. 36 PRJEB53466]|nr:unnamed protein product [Caenorhabditis sp. 36 PRJEB53466]
MSSDSKDKEKQQVKLMIMEDMHGESNLANIISEIAMIPSEGARPFDDVSQICDNWFEQLSKMEWNETNQRIHNRRVQRVFHQIAGLTPYQNVADEILDQGESSSSHKVDEVSARAAELSLLDRKEPTADSTDEMESQKYKNNKDETKEQEEELGAVQAVNIIGDAARKKNTFISLLDENPMAGNFDGMKNKKEQGDIKDTKQEMELRGVHAAQKIGGPSYRKDLVALYKKAPSVSKFSKFLASANNGIDRNEDTKDKKREQEEDYTVNKKSVVGSPESDVEEEIEPAPVDQQSRKSQRLQVKEQAQESIEYKNPFFPYCEADKQRPTKKRSRRLNMDRSTKKAKKAEEEEVSNNEGNQNDPTLRVGQSLVAVENTVAYVSETEDESDEEEQ